MLTPVVTPRAERASGGQLYANMVLFILGTTWLFIPGADLGRDAWIAALMGLGSGLLWVCLYLRLAKLFPGESLTEWLPRLCGPVLGYLLGVIYSVYFLYCCARNLRDMAELLRLSFLTRTPILALTLLQASLVSMTSYYGLETALRAKQVLLPIVLFMQFLVGFGFWARRYWPHVFPILEYGVGPVWYYSFPLITTVPYGELVVFLFLFPFIRDRVNRSAIAATLTGGGLLVFIAFMAVLVIGPANLANSALPYYTTVRSITFGDVVQRLDGVIVPMLAFCAYAKASTYMKGSAYGFAHMLGARRPASLAFPLTFLAAGMASSMAVSWGQHLDVGLQIVPYALHLPLQFIIPLLLWLLAEFRTRRPSMRPPRPLMMDTPPKWTRIVATILALLLWVPTFLPHLLASAPLTTYILRPLATYIGSPVARLLGGQPMQK